VVIAATTGFAERAARPLRDRKLTATRLAGPPDASLAFGEGGIAYFLLRHAYFGGGAASLEAAKRWAANAESSRGQPGVFGDTSPTLAQSLYFREPGVWWVGALVGAALGEVTQVQRLAGQFAEGAARAYGTPGDVTVGSAGLLLGCAQLVESMGDPVAVAPVRAVGERLALKLGEFAERDGALLGDTALGFLGAAHGWGGVAHALLRWSVVVDRPPPAQVLALLDRLIEQRRPSGRWPVRAGSRKVYRGWCHGSAGWAQTWALAWKTTGEERFLALAEQSAEDAIDADADNASLCCGRTGQAYAALTLYRATRDRRWLTAAHRVAVEAVHLCELDETPRHALFSGELGVALLIVELEDPDRAAMPVYEALA
jgi:eukaryotic-like serine/threonine-protein kinase